MRPNASSLPLLLAALLLIGADAAEAQTVRGKLQWQRGGETWPAPNLRVRLYSEATELYSHPVYTGGDGMYYIHNAEAGPYLLEVRGDDDQLHHFQIQVLPQRYTDIQPITLPAQGERGSAPQTSEGAGDGRPTRTPRS